jgi:hypothetical protein
MNREASGMESGASANHNSLPEPHPTTVRSLVALGFANCTLASARRLHAAGVRVHVIELVRRPRKFLRPSNAVSAVGATLEWSVAGTPEGLSAVRQFAERVQADALITVDDFCLTWLGKHRSSFEPRCKVLAPAPDVLERLLDKSHQIDLAGRSGFDLLPTWTLSNPAVLSEIPANAYPIVIRPSQTNSSEPRFKAKVLSTWLELCALVASTRWLCPPVVQPFCLGPNYVLHGVRAESGEMLALELFKAYRKYSGFTVSMEPAPLPPSLRDAARRFVDAEGLTGPFHFELVRPEGGGPYYFLEINCRLGGTTAKAMHLGFDEPGLTLQAFHVRTPRPLKPLPFRSRVTTASLNLVQAVNHLRKQRDPLAYPQKPWLRSVVSAVGEAIRVGDPVLTLRDPLSCIWFARKGKRG